MSFSARVPAGTAWVDDGPRAVANGRAYRRGALLAISSLQIADLPDGSGETGPQWHVSISLKGKRPKDNHVRSALRDFGMLGAEEDNHHPGNARHFWMPCDPARRVDCECKASEDVIVDPDCYRWTNPTADSGEGCRGCEFVAIGGKPCPLHSARDGAGA